MKRVLIVDDNEENRYLLRQLIQGHGYEVEEARHGAEALVKARKTPPDLVVSDLLMPVMDGFALLRRWKADEALRKVPFVVYTATYTDPKDERLALDLGADAFIIKPAEPEMFAERLRALCPQGVYVGPSAHRPLLDDLAAVRAYNEALARKLEKKTAELVETAERLRQSERRLREMIDGLGPLMFVGLMTPDGTLLEANRPELEAAGLQVSDVVGKPFDQTYWWSYSGPVQDQLRAAIERAGRGESVRYDVPVRGLGGEMILIDFSIRPLRDARGKVVYLVPSAVVITERKRAEEALRESEERLRLALEAARMGTFDWDIVRNRISWSRGHEELFGYGSGEFGGTYAAFEERVYPDDLAGVNTKVARCIATRERFQHEFRVAWPDGSVHWIQGHGEFTFDNDGRAVRMRGVVQDVTERKHIEAALLDNEEKLRLFIHFAPSAIAMFDREMRYIAYSRRWLKDYDLGDQDLTGRSHYDVFPEIPERWKEIHRRCLAGAVEKCDEDQFPRADGSVDWVRWEIHPWRRDRGEIGGILIFSEVITDRVKAEQALKTQVRLADFAADVATALATEELLPEFLRRCAQAFVDRLDAAFARIWTLNAETNMLELQVSAGLYTHIDGAHARIPLGALKIGRIAKDRTPSITNDVPNDPRVSDKEWARREGMVAFAGYPLIVEDQVLGVMAMFARRPLDQPLLDAMASVANSIAVGIQRKQSENTLRKLSAAVEQSPTGVMITDVEGAIDYVNPGFTRMTGYTLEEVRGKNPRLLKSGEKPPEFYRELWETILAGREWHGELRNRRKDGSLYWSRNIIAPIRNRGAVTHFVALMEDVTAQKSLEAQFRQAQKMEAVGRLAGGIAHDFNNMLSVIIGYTDAVIGEMKSVDPIYEDLIHVRAAAMKSVELTRQLLAFSRQQTIVPHELDLNEHVRGMEGLLRRLVGEDIELRLALASETWPVKLDPSQIDQIVVNLVTNARDAMPGGGRLTLMTANVDVGEDLARRVEGAAPGPYVELAVSDTGCGMTEEVLAQIFEPFFTTKATGKGTGLGLATVYGIVKQNQGFIDVESRPGAGTTFRISFPRYHGAGRAPVAEAPEAQAAGGGETILFVEDDAMLRPLGQRMLERLGYRALTAADPAEAMALCEAHGAEIALLLTDVVMPMMSGRELAERVCALKPEIKVLYMSGYTADAIAQRGVLHEGVNFIGKPFSMEALSKKIREVLDAKK